MLKYLSPLWSTLATTGLVVGICCSLTALGVAIGILTLLTIFRQLSISQLLLISFAILSGYYLYHRRISQHKIFNSIIQNQTITITGIITEYHKISSSRLKHRLTIKIQNLQIDHQEVLTSQSIYIYATTNPKLLIGQIIKISNLKFKDQAHGNFQDFLIKNEIAASIFVTDLKLEVLSNKQSYWHKIAQLKSDLSRRLTKKMNPEAGAAFSSIFLGHKDIHPYEQAIIKNNFQTWGVVHYLARAGLHLILITMIWQLLINFWQLPIWLSQFLIMALFLIFNLLSASAIPFMRALVSLILSRSCQILGLQVHTLHVLNLACLIILFLNPSALFFLDFQLSFGLTYGLIILNELRFWQTLSVNQFKFYCLSIF